MLECEITGGSKEVRLRYSLPPWEAVISRILRGKRFLRILAGMLMGKCPQRHAVENTAVKKNQF
jgi:hypothetical protein